MNYELIFALKYAMHSMQHALCRGFVGSTNFCIWWIAYPANLFLFRHFNGWRKILKLIFFFYIYEFESINIFFVKMNWNDSVKWLVAMRGTFSHFLPVFLASKEFRSALEFTTKVLLQFNIKIFTLETRFIVYPIVFCCCLLDMLSRKPLWAPAQFRSVIKFLYLWGFGRCSFSAFRISFPLWVCVCAVVEIERENWGYCGFFAC